ncbi:MAG: RHS repeat-associated core domain-containing protein [Parachlamydiales bacterium]|jgi:RHS repeat-associated protein
MFLGLLIVLSCSLLAEDNPAFSYPLPFQLEECVSLQTGDLSFQIEDLAIHGKEPVVIRRSYNSSKRREKEGGWSFWPETKMTLSKKSFWNNLLYVFNPYKKQKEQADYYLCLTAENGEDLELGGFLHKDTKVIFFEGRANPGCRTAQAAGLNEEISAKANYSNLRIEIDLKKARLTAFLPNGGKRVYQTEFGSYDDDDLPLEFFLSLEIKPNGNKLRYFWDSSKHLSEIKSFSPSDKLVYASAKFFYNGSKDGKHNFQILASDGRRIQYSFSRIQRKKDKSESHYLRSVSSNFAPTECYEYESRQNQQGPGLESLYLPQGKILEVEYFSNAKDKRNHLVRSLKLPQNQALAKAYIFDYSIEKNKKSSRSSKTDLEGNRTEYFFHTEEGLEGRLKAIEIFLESSPKGFFGWGRNRQKYSTQRFYYDQAGNLCGKALFDSANQALMAKGFSYDQRGNVVKETLFGDLTGEKSSAIELRENGQPKDHPEQSYSKFYRYSQDSFNLCLEEKEENGLKSEYAYKPGTDLVISKILKSGEEVLERHFFEYDHENVLIKAIEDDGSSLDPDNLNDLTCRKIKYFTLSSKAGLFNLTESCEEKYMDQNRCEKLLKKSLFTYAPNGRIVQETVFDALNTKAYSIKYNYNSLDLLASKSDPFGQVFSYFYDSNFNLAEIQEGESGPQKLFKYDQLNRQIQRTTVLENKQQATTFFAYDYKNNLLAATDERGHKTAYFYDGLGRLFKTIYPAVLNEHKVTINPTEEIEYDLLGHPIKKTNPQKESIQTAYTLYHQPKEIVFPNGKKEKYTYDKNGRIKTICRENGVKELFTYNPLGCLLLKQRLNKSGQLLSEESWLYKGRRLLQKTAKNGLKTCYQYDAAGRLAEEKFKDENLNLEKRTSYTYDPLGFEESRTLYLSEQMGLREKFKRDLAGRVLEAFQENLPGQVFERQSYSYDSFGNLEKRSVFSNQGQILSQEHFFYDLKGRLLKQLDPMGQTTVFSYNDAWPTEDGDLACQTALQDPEGHLTLQTFDSLGRLALIEKKNPSGSTVAKINYYYDASGNKALAEELLFLKDKPLFKKTTQWIWENGQIKKVILAKGSPSEKTYQITYNKQGLKSSLKKPSNLTLFYEYDENERLIKLKSSDGTIDFAYTYNINGDLTAAADLKTGLTLKRSFDLFGRLCQEEAGGFKVSQKTDLFGRTVQLTLPDLSTIDYAYDEYNLKTIRRLKNKQSFTYRYLNYEGQRPLNAEIENLTPIHYHFDKLGRKEFVSSRFFQQQAAFSPSGLITGLKTHAFPEAVYEYDGLFQIKSEKGAFDLDYLFDSNFNLKQKNQLAFDSSEASELISDFDYDTDGLPIRSKSSGDLFYYDALGRLSAFVSSKVKIEYTYDALNRRFSKTLAFPDSPKTPKNYFLNFGSQEIGLLEEDGSLSELKIFSPPSAFQGPELVALELTTAQNGSRIYPVLNDLRGNLAALLDEKGIRESYLYSAFGETRIFSSRRQELKTSFYGRPYAFQGCKEEENGLIFFSNRYFDPQRARFLTPDPLGLDPELPESSNPYFFAHNNPFKEHDPKGLSPEQLFPNRSLYHHCKNSLQTAFNWLALPLRIAGFGLELVGRHLMPVPVFQDLICIGGRFLALNFSSCSPEESRFFTLGSFDPKANLFFVHGIMNGRSSALKSARLLNDLAQKNGQTAFFSHPSHGFLGDLFETLALKLKIETGTVKELRKTLKTYLNRLDSDGRLLIIAHSQGALLTRMALKKLSSDELAKLEIRNFGLAAPNQGTDSQSYLSSRDLPGRLLSFSKAKTLQARSSAAWIDHAFNGATYHARARAEIEGFFRN